MRKAVLFVTAAWAGIASVASAQQSAPAPQQAAEAGDEDSIIVTATRRPERLQDVPIAVNVVTAESLANSGASDIRTLNQLSPSLLVSSTSSEAGAGVARIRGIGTVGDNPGLESSVGVFIDGVYRNRSGVALTELGPVERIEVLRGPQGTLFGRNTSAGLINVVTAKPKFENEGYGAFTIGNYDAYRVEGGFTGPIAGDSLAVRVDGVWFQRDGFIRDVISDRRVNDRDRYLLRGQLLFEPTDDVEIRIVADYAKRNEECCAAIYGELTDYQRAAGTPAGQIGEITKVPSVFAPVLQGMTDPAGNPAYLNDDISKYRTSITPGRDYQSDVRDWGLSGEVNWDLGGVNITSITAYRDWKWNRGQDADYNNLDLFYRDDYEQTFKTFSQELRAQGEAFEGRLDWLVGGYFASEDLTIEDNLKFGTQFDQYASRFLAFANPALAGFPLFGYANLRGFSNAALAAQGVPAPVRNLFTPLVRNLDINDVGETTDFYEQNSRNFALFTHNQIEVTEKIGLTLGLRYTNERKTVSTDFNSDNTACADIQRSIADVTALGNSNPALKPVGDALAANLRGISGIPCLINLNTNYDLALEDQKNEDQFTGTAVLSYKPTERLLVYGSYSRGYKAGGFNLDRSALNPLAPRVEDLLFAPETVNAYEIGAKYDGRGIDVNVALFRSDFKNFQLNTFNGLSFIVENIGGCSEDLAAPAGASFYGACAGDLKSGVRSQGVELEIYANPMADLSLNAGVTYAQTEYKDEIVGANGRAIPNDLFRLPGRNLSNAPEWVLTGAATYTPPIGDTGYSALFYVDGRWQSKFNTGSDLDVEKFQDSFAVFNGRIGLRGPDQRWSLEFWSQNMFNARYTQIAFDAPLQPIGGTPGSRVTDLPAGTTLPNGTAFSANRSNALFGRFPGEPRTFGMTVRTKF